MMASIHVVLTVSSLILVSWSTVGDSLRVTTALGRIEGSVVSVPDDSGRKCHVFYSVPFAEPPVGKNRFKFVVFCGSQFSNDVLNPFRKPVRVKEWNGIKDATRVGPQCIQMPSNVRWKTSDSESEDCLRLDITLPQKHDVSGKKKSVMVFFHGGESGLIRAGGASVYKPEEICGTFGSRDVIFVTIQYRLGYLGYLSDGTDDFPGNIAQWDQIEALKLFDSIELRGDKSSITIFGASSGAAHVSALSYIVQAQNLYSRSIAQSGSLLAPGYVNDRSVNSTFKLIQNADCQDEDSVEAVSCLREKSIDELQEAELAGGSAVFKHFPDAHTLKGGGYQVFTARSNKWGPRIDEDLLTGPPEQMIGKMERKAFITGTTSRESLLWFTHPLIKKYAEADGGPPVSLSNDAEVSLPVLAANIWEAAKLFSKSDDRKVIDALAKMIRFIYLQQSDDLKANMEKDPQFLSEKLIDLHSDVIYNLPSILDADLKRRNGWTVWMYNFDTAPENLYPINKKFSGSQHGDELYYMFNDFGFGSVNSLLTEADRKVQKTLLDLWTRFAKHDNPSYGQLGDSALKWAPYETFENPAHLHIGLSSTEMSMDFHKETVSFWTQMAGDLVKAVSEEEKKQAEYRKKMKQDL